MDYNIMLVKESTYIYESKIMKMDYNIALVKKNYESRKLSKKLKYWKWITILCWSKKVLIDWLNLKLILNN